ncbi:MAG: energy-coupling factor ABC transporter ATP-binding protein [Candidatus Marinimicrobia bacterium]|nr:energy-coupling factor ABC transporter ATP-binding protein [Candidatus Neomarinimicrobiota bacterium]
MGCHVQVKELFLSYRWKTFEKSIFQNLNLCIPEGTYVSIKGSNGSGKSSLIKLILGLIKPDSGEIMVNGEAVHAGYPEAVRNGKIVYMGQQIEDLFYGETVIEELSYETEELTPQYMQLIQDLGMESLLERSVESLSGGEKQGLALAQLMGNSAPLIILDEPSSYLDRNNARILRKYLKETHAAGKTILHVTQYTSELDWGTHLIDLDQSQPELKAL